MSGDPWSWTETFSRTDRDSDYEGLFAYLAGGYEPPQHEAPPFIHTLRLPGSEEEMRADPARFPQYTVSEDAT